ncbi:nucleoside kinase [Clostridium subterminale]|uniref:Nucleoside kinase n=1 Tax=Clostridium subterminale TaxID=1550 RepID=A0ABP3W4F2_CLOSU
MDKIKIRTDERMIEVHRGITCYDLIKNYGYDHKAPIVLVKVDGKLKELSTILEKDCNIEFIDITDKQGMMCYIRSLQFVLIKATKDLFPESKIIIEHSLSKGLFGEIYKDIHLGIDDVYAIKKRMHEIIDANMKIEKKNYIKEDAIDLFREAGMDDKVSVFKNVNEGSITIYKLGKEVGYFYGLMIPYTDILKYFDLIYYDPGFILRFPTQEEPTQIPRFEKHKKLAKVFYEAEKWGDILNIAHVGALNDEIEHGDIVTLVRVAEALHEKKIANIADKIKKNGNIKLILIAGPSSSGKTTFCKRLGIQMRVNGLIPVPISLDDYFIDREHTPKDEFGEYDFESITALDLQLFNEQLQMLLNGEEVELPTYNFITGKREWLGNKVKLPDKGVIVIEGIHGLNEVLTASIPHNHKFKIYISPLTQINMDSHNRIATTDVRMIRRIVRDYLSRGYDVEYTLKMWASIRRGEDKNIFPYQEYADVMFNSALIYELAVLKKYALEELYKVKPESPVYNEARRLIDFLHFFKEVDKDVVPTNSLITEFIGGSCFYQY